MIIEIYPRLIHLLGKTHTFTCTAADGWFLKPKSDKRIRIVLRMQKYNWWPPCCQTTWPWQQPYICFTYKLLFQLLWHSHLEFLFCFLHQLYCSTAPFWTEVCNSDLPQSLFFFFFQIVQLYFIVSFISIILWAADYTKISYSSGSSLYLNSMHLWCLKIAFI